MTLIDQLAAEKVARDAALIAFADHLETLFRETLNPAYADALGSLLIHCSADGLGLEAPSEHMAHLGAGLLSGAAALKSPAQP